MRGAPLIGTPADFGLWLAMREDASDAALEAAYRRLLATRPTAVNLRWAPEVRAPLRPLALSARPEAAVARAVAIADEDAAINRRTAWTGSWSGCGG